MDAEGEMEQEHEAVVRQEASVAVHPEIGQPSPVSFSSFVCKSMANCVPRRMLATLNKCWSWRWRWSRR